MGLGIFLGGVLRPRRSIYDRPWRTALGYQFDAGYDASSVILLRHRLMATGHGGNQGRFFYQLGGGIGTGADGLFLLGPVVRLGVALPAPQWSFNGFVVGGSATVDSVVVEFPRTALRFGVFLGWALI